MRLPGRASVTDRMRDDLHWLDVSKHITFKHCVLAFKCQTGLAPSYLTSSCVSSSTVPGRVSLRSASTNTMLLPRTRTKTIGPRGFFYSCPAVWNNLPNALRILDQSLSVFKKNLKRFFFKIDSLVTVVLYVAVILVLALNFFQMKFQDFSV